MSEGGSSSSAAGQGGGGRRKFGPKKWAELWKTLKELNRIPDAIGAASQAFDSLLEDSEPFLVESEMFLDLGDDLLSKKDYPKAVKVFDTGETIFKHFKNEKATFEAWKLLKERLEMAEILAGFREPLAKTEGSSSQDPVEQDSSEKLSSPSSSEDPNSSQKLSPLDSAPSHQFQEDSSHQACGQVSAQSNFNPFKFSVELNCSIDEYVSNMLYKGSVASFSHTLRHSFIDLGNFMVETEELQRVLKLAEKETCVLSFRDLVQSDSTFFVITDEVVPVDHFFRLQHSEFSELASSSSWWNHIENDFRVIFRDVVHALMFLFDSGSFCGNLRDNIFVTADHRGRVLPAFNSKVKRNKGVRRDIYELRNRMTYILGLGMDVEENIPDFPLELQSLLKLLNPNQAVVASWAVNHPFFWVTRERYNFIHELDILRREARIQWEELDKCLCRFPMFADPAYWSHSISDILFKKLYENSKRGSAANTLDFERVKPYQTAADIIRYMVASFKHANEKKYDCFKEPECKSYSIEEIDACLQNFFPSACCDIFESLHLYRLNGEAKLDLAVLKRLAKCCRIKDN